MKKTLLFFVILSLLITKTFGWNKIFETTLGDFKAVSFPSADSGYAVSLNGYIFNTIDGGNTWNQQNSGTTAHLYDVFFVNNNVGYVVGGNFGAVILKTVDGGNNWTTQISPMNHRLNSVFFTDSNNGFAVGTYGTIIKTVDGGNTWEIAANGFTNVFYNVFFTNDTIGFVIGGSGIILKTTDAGNTWNSQNSGTTASLYSVFFSQENIGYICGTNTFLKTTDGGNNWINQQTNIIFGSFDKIYFTDDLTGYVATGKIYKTTDGGLSWFIQAIDRQISIADIYFVNDTVGYAVGGHSILKTSIGGGYPDYDILSGNNISARFNTNGSLFWDQLAIPAFEVPKGSGKNTIFSGAISIGGTDNTGQLHLLGNRIGNSGDDLFSGPIMDSIYYKYNQEKWNRIWKISRSEIENHMVNWSSSGYQISNSILDWPGNGDTLKGMLHNIAPYYDFNGDGNYTPLQGDYPIIKGDEALFYVVNDSMLPHTETGGKNLGLELHIMAYSFNCQEDSALWNTVFLNYEIINRSNKKYDSTFVGILLELIMGVDDDNYIGCDVQRSSFYAYNGDSLDGDGSGSTYGAYPPAQAVTILGGPFMDSDGSDYGSSGIAAGCDESVNGLNFNDGIIDNERLGMSRVMTYCGCTGAYAYPYSAETYYTYLRGYFTDTTHLTYGGSGHLSSSQPANFIFPGQPNTDPCGWGTGGVPQPDWSEETANNPPDHSSGMASAGPFTMLQGSVHNVDLAFVFGRDFVNPNNRASIAIMQQRIDSVRKYFITGQTPCGTFNIGIKENRVETNSVSIFPNPTNDYFNFKINNYPRSSLVKIFTFDGKFIREEKFEGNEGKVDVQKLTSGLYLIELITEKDRFVRKLIITGN